MSIQVLIDEIRKSERTPLIPRINAFRGALKQDREQTAFEMERATVHFIATMRQLFDNLQENLPLDQRMESAESYLTDTLNGALDMVSNARGA